MKAGYFALIISFFMTSCGGKHNLIHSIMDESGKFETILSNPDKYKLQVLYTQIDRNADNSPSFTTHKFMVNPAEYFYPASTVKLPMAALALEKINRLSIPGLTARAEMRVDNAFAWQQKFPEDTASFISGASVEECIRRIFLVSDNEAFNKLYEFVGQKEINRKLSEKGYINSNITHRLSIPLAFDENRKTAPVRFYHGDTLIYTQEELWNDEFIPNEIPRPIGRAYYTGDSLIQQPLDFKHKNELGLEDLHAMLLSILFPESVDPGQRFELTGADYDLLYKAMYQFPKESGISEYESYDDVYCKFVYYGGSGEGDPNIRVLNKVGEAYGFLIDMAYVVDFERKIEFILGAVIYVNEDEILNDDRYEYDSVGFPFFKNLGRVFYDYERGRHREHTPDLSAFKTEP